MMIHFFWSWGRNISALIFYFCLVQRAQLKISCWKHESLSQGCFFSQEYFFFSSTCPQNIFLNQLILIKILIFYDWPNKSNIHNWHSVSSHSRCCFKYFFPYFIMWNSSVYFDQPNFIGHYGYFSNFCHYKQCCSNDVC